MAAPAFFTTRELDRFLGGGQRGPKQRQRLLQGQLLPHPAPIGRVRRANVAVYPRFALAGLVGELSQYEDAKECLADLSQRTFNVTTFPDLADAVRSSVSSREQWRFDQLVDDVVHKARPAVKEWTTAVRSGEKELLDRFGISFSTDSGQVEKVDSRLCIVSLAHGGTESFAVEKALPVEEGRAVAVERIKVMDTMMSFVMPSTVDVLDPDEQEMSKWLVKMMTTPDELAVDQADDSTADPLPYRRPSGPRQRRSRGASTMTRVPSAG